MDLLAGGSEAARGGSVPDQGLGAAAEQAAKELVPPMETAGVKGQKPLHAGPKIGLGRLDNQVQVVRHQAAGMDLPAGLGAGLARGVDEALAVLVVFEDGFAAVAAIHDVVKGPRVLDAQLARHDDRLPH